MQKKIIYLYAELMGYQYAILNKYVELGFQVLVVHWDKKKLTPYFIPNNSDIQFLGKSKYDTLTLFQKCKDFKPDVIYVSGWMDKDYLSICKKLKQENKAVKVIGGSDTQLRGNLKQRLGVYYFKLFYKSIYDYLWVAGPKQYEYALKLGFKSKQIISNSLTADTGVFKFTGYSTVKKSFVFVGRFNEVKGIDLLIKAWDEIKDKKGWNLTLIGNGEYLNDIDSSFNDVVIKNFLQPGDLVKEFKEASCFILPSRNEPWGVVIHEAACLGLPIIVSDICGANELFVKNNFNGYVFKSEDVSDLKNKIKNIMDSTENELCEFSNNSLKLSKKNSIELSVAEILNIL